ncbi:hypothetical protein HPP92_027797 [Vanilla planifolia]|uniref:Uncharacterized protein n=1 Tax=Vanilla planifolia TaxID=51239 RepID=A0A835PB61_VANPL|nr:hypothetical protein HPP92_027797 [Vanilla planifolia]
MRSIFSLMLFTTTDKSSHAERSSTSNISSVTASSSYEMVRCFLILCSSMFESLTVRFFCLLLLSTNLATGSRGKAKPNSPHTKHHLIFTLEELHPSSAPFCNRGGRKGFNEHFRKLVVSKS